MAPNENTQFNQMRNHIEEIRNDLAGVKKTIVELYHALVGNSVLKDGGLVRKFEDLEAKVIDQAKKHEELKQSYVQLKWLALGVAIGAGVLGFSIKDIVHYFLK